MAKEDPRRPEPTDRAEFGDRASAEGESGLPITETSLEGEGAKGKEAYELESALQSEFPRGRRRGNGVMEKRGGAGRVAQSFEKTCGVLEERVERSGRVEFP